MNDPGEVLERALRRDAAMRAAGKDPGSGAESNIIDVIVKYRLYDSEAARRWLVERSSTQDYWVGKRIVESIGPLSQSGHAADAVAVFSSLVGLENEADGPKRRKNVLHIGSGLGHDIKDLLRTPGLISSHPDVWGPCVARLQSLLLFEAQEEEIERWEHTSGSLKTRCPDYDRRICRLFFETRRPRRDAWGVVAQAIAQSSAETASLPDRGPFSVLAGELITSEWELVICQPLVALYDCIVRRDERCWQHDEAIRLLCLVEVEQAYSPFAWRRLLRRQLIRVLSDDERNALLTRIRESQENEHVRVSELADFEDCGILAQDEQGTIDNARRDGELFEPSDPRELRSVTERASFSSETPANQFIKTWPHSEDHASLRLLVDAERIGGEATIVDVEASLFPRLDALNTVLDRAEIDSPDWLGEILGWCDRAIEDLKQWCRIKHQIPKDAEIPVDQYLGMLQENAPWWENRVAAALERLKQPPPEGHASQQSDHIFWSSNDPIAGSLKYLDELLAAPSGSKLDVYRADLAQSVVEAWDTWPSYTRGLTVAILRTYYWATCGELSGLLVRSLKTETDSHDIEFALHHLLQLGQSGIAQLMRSLIDRVDTLTNPADIAHLIGGVIGNAVARYRGDGEHVGELADISDWYEELKADRLQGASVRSSLVASILEGARSHLGSLDQLRDEHAETWLLIVNWGLSEWLELNEGQKNDLPILPVTSVREMRWNRHQCILLLEGMSEVLTRVITEADLGGFYEMHYELRNLLRDDQTQQDPFSACAMGPSSDQILIGFCRASAERVAQWRKEGKTTNDLAYGVSLSGDNTSELITLVFESATDRENARRELAPIIDILADAGLRDASSRLRSKLRHS